MKNVFFPIGCGVYPKLVGGMEIFNYYLIKSLSKDICVSYMALEKYDFDGPDFIRMFNFKPTKLFYPLQVFIYLLFKKKIDAIVYSYSSACWILWDLYCKIATTLNIPYIIVIHHGKEPPTENFECYKKFFSKARKVVAVSNDIKANFDKKYGINCEVIYPLVPFEKTSMTKNDIRKKYNIPLTANVICMVGSLKKMKNPDTILEALSLMTEEELSMMNPYIVYAGKGNMMAELKEKADTYRLSERINFLGFIPKEKVGEVMTMSDIYLIASDFEGTSVSLLEAMYNGKPIIASEAPGIKDTIGKKECLIFPVGDSNKLKDTVVQMLGSEILRNEFSSYAEERFLREYSYDLMLKQYYKIL